MAETSKTIFRKKSLERLSTPDRLDQLLRVVRRRLWIPLLACGGLLVLAVVWCFLGRVPITADATAVLVHPRQVVPLQAPADGELLTLRIHVGKEVRKDEVIATLARTDLQKELELESMRLKQFRARSKELTGFSVDQLRQQKAYFERQRKRLEARIEAVEDMAEKVKKRTDAYNEEQRNNLEETKRHSTDLDKALKARLESYVNLKAEGLASQDAVVSSRQRWIANLLGLAEIEVQLQELELRKIRANEVYQSQMDLVADLNLQLERIQLQELEAENKLAEAQVLDRTDEQEILLNIDRLKSALETQTVIKADDDGVVLEITVSPGSMVVAGQRIASMAKDDKNQTLRALAYFDIADGKKVQEGMSARVSPVTVQQQRHGSIYASVTDVSRYPVTADAVVNQVGNREMASMLVGAQSRIEVIATLETDAGTATGLKWTSRGGPDDVVISAGTTARVRVTLAERAPITLLIPALRGWLGLD